MTELTLRRNGEKLGLGIESDGATFRLRVDGKTVEGRFRRREDGCILVTIGRRHVPVWLAADGDRVHVHCEGRRHVLEVVDEDAERLRRKSAAGPSEADRIITPPMPGKVIKLLVAEGDEVRKNQGIVIVEAMKMENEIKAAMAARVKKIHCAVGDLKNPGDPLVELEPIASGPAAEVE